MLEATWDEIMSAADQIAANAYNSESAFYAHSGATAFVVELKRRGFKIVKEENPK